MIAPVIDGSLFTILSILTGLAAVVALLCLLGTVATVLSNRYGGAGRGVLDRIAGLDPTLSPATDGVPAQEPDTAGDADQAPATAPYGVDVPSAPQPSRLPAGAAAALDSILEVRPGSPPGGGREASGEFRLAAMS